LRPKRCRLTRHARLRWRVAQKLALQWSPEQIGFLCKPFDEKTLIECLTVAIKLQSPQARRRRTA
jgi:IS30 family transposase